MTSPANTPGAPAPSATGVPGGGALLSVTVTGEEAMVRLGRWIGEQVESPFHVMLEGDLGAGKTTLARGILRGAGHPGNVKSPTYTLVESYDLPTFCAHHFDLYRLRDPEELEFMGIRDYFSGDTVVLVEWSKNGLGILPQPDIQLNVGKSGSCREVLFFHFNERGRALLEALAKRVAEAAETDIARNS
jgi:tRNA threonylcarbamoyladenosine biosynthesis protein TsaE